MSHPPSQQRYKYGLLLLLGMYTYDGRQTARTYRFDLGRTRLIEKKTHKTLMMQQYQTMMSPAPLQSI